MRSILKDRDRIKSLAQLHNYIPDNTPVIQKTKDLTVLSALTIHYSRRRLRSLRRNPQSWPPLHTL